MYTCIIYIYICKSNIYNKLLIQRYKLLFLAIQDLYKILIVLTFLPFLEVYCVVILNTNQSITGHNPLLKFY